MMYLLSVMATCDGFVVGLAANPDFTVVIKESSSSQLSEGFDSCNRMPVV